MFLLILVYVLVEYLSIIDGIIYVLTEICILKYDNLHDKIELWYVVYPEHLQEADL